MIFDNKKLLNTEIHVFLVFFFVHLTFAKKEKKMVGYNEKKDF